MNWGAEIAVDGKRPEWLRDDERVECYGPGMDWWDGVGGPAGRWESWGNYTAIRLPADHPYYRATAAGFTYWPGGVAAPADWDEGEVLFRDGIVRARVHRRSTEWQRGFAGDVNRYAQHDIIGYRKRVEAWNKPGTVVWQPSLPTYDPATHVAVPLMTEEEMQDLYHRWVKDDETRLDAWAYVGHLLGIIRPEPTDLERYQAAHPDWALRDREDLIADVLTWRKDA